MKRLTFLIIGVGEVGTNVCEKLKTLYPNARLHIHTLSYNSMNAKVETFRCLEGQGNEINGSYGDIFLTKSGLSNSESTTTEQDLLKYLYGNYEGWYQDSMIYELIKNVQPDYIIDTVTLAVKFNNNVPCKLYDDVIKNNHKKPYLLEFLSSNPIANLSNYVQALGKALKDFSVKSYTKVSSSGLGGMGFDCPYTHGSGSNHKLNSSLEYKIAAVGMMQQLLWNLADSTLVKINLIVPKALIGLGQPFTCIKHHKKTIIRIDRQTKQRHQETIINPSIACIPCGDSTYYSLQEAMLASHPSQFGIITKEEVAQAVIDCLENGDRHNLLVSMEKASLHTTEYARTKKEQIINKALKLDKLSTTPSIVTGNFGPFIAKYIAELYVIKNASLSTIDENTDDLDERSQACNQFITANTHIKDQILASNLQIKTDRYQWFPNEVDIEESNDCQYRTVDLSGKNIKRWDEFLTNYFDTQTSPKELYNLVPMERLGIIVASFLSYLGFQRHKQFTQNL